MQNTILRTILMLLSIAAAISTWADTKVVDGIAWSYMVSDGKATVCSGTSGSPAVYSSTTGSITISSTFDDCPVMSTGDYAFYKYSVLTSEAIPSSVTSIGRWVFRSFNSMGAWKYREIHSSCHSGFTL